MTGPVFYFHIDCEGFEPSTIALDGRSSTTELTVFPQGVLVRLLHGLLTTEYNTSLCLSACGLINGLSGFGVSQPFFHQTAWCPTAQTVELLKLPIDHHRSSGGHVMGEVAKPLRSALLRFHVSFRTQHPDLPTIAARGRRRTTLRFSPALPI